MKLMSGGVNYEFDLSIYENFIKIYKKSYQKSLTTSKKYKTIDNMKQDIMKGIINNIIVELTKDEISKKYIKDIRKYMEKTMIKNEDNDKVKVGIIIYKPIKDSNTKYKFEVNISAIFNFFKIEKIKGV